MVFKVRVGVLYIIFKIKVQYVLGCVIYYVERIFNVVCMYKEFNIYLLYYMFISVFIFCLSFIYDSVVIWLQLFVYIKEINCSFI